MSLLSGTTKIDAVFVGGGGTGTPETVYSRVSPTSSEVGRSGSASVGSVYAGDMILLVVGHSASSPPSTPSGFTLYESMSSSGIGNAFTSAIYYKFATAASNSSNISFGLTTVDWMTYVISGVNRTKPFGGYAERDNASSKSPSAPAITMTQTNGYGLVFHAYSSKETVGQWLSVPSTYVPGLQSQIWNQWGMFRRDRTTAAVAAQAATETTATACFGHTIELLPHSAVFTPGLASAVYLGSEKVWPIIATPERVFSTPGSYTYTVPQDTQKLDIVCLGGGGGGGKGDISGTGAGGTAGVWGARTLRVGLDVAVGQAINIIVGAGGKGNVGLDPGSPGKTGEASTAKGLVVGAGGIGGDSGGLYLQGMPGTPGGEPGNFAYNGRTYTGGVGGVPGSNMSNNYPGYGLDGNAPGVGGEGGDGVVIGYNGGGTGGAGRVWVSAY